MWAQVLVGARVLRRAAMALEDRAVLALCDGVEASAWKGEWRIRTPSACAGVLRAAAMSLADAAAGAEGAQSFPVDATVTLGVRRCIDAVRGVRGANGVQVAIVVAADVDQVGFACREVGVGAYDGLGAHVRGRLAPVHGLCIVEPAPTPEEEFR